MEEFVSLAAVKLGGVVGHSAEQAIVPISKFRLQ